MYSMIFIVGWALSIMITLRAILEGSTYGKHILVLLVLLLVGANAMGCLHIDFREAYSPTNLTR